MHVTVHDKGKPLGNGKNRGRTKPGKAEREREREEEGEVRVRSPCRTKNIIVVIAGREVGHEVDTKMK